MRRIFGGFVLGVLATTVVFSVAAYCEFLGGLRFDRLFESREQLITRLEPVSVVTAPNRIPNQITQSIDRITRQPSFPQAASPEFWKAFENEKRTELLKEAEAARTAQRRHYFEGMSWPELILELGQRPAVNARLGRVDQFRAEDDAKLDSAVFNLAIGFAANWKGPAAVAAPPASKPAPLPTPAATPSR